MNNPKKQMSISRYVKIEDYKVFDYEIPEIFLDFVIKKNAVNVTTKLKLVKKNKNTRNLILDGSDISIKNYLCLYFQFLSYFFAVCSVPLPVVSHL